MVGPVSDKISTMSLKVLMITGADGEEDLLKSLLEYAHKATSYKRVRVMTNLGVDLDNVSTGDVVIELVSGDCTLPEDVRKHMFGVYQVIHIASEHKRKAWLDIYTSTKVVVDCSMEATVRNFVLCSSADVIFGLRRKVTPNIQDKVEPYKTCLSKKNYALKCAEKYTLEQNGCGIKTTVVRPSGMFGPNSKFIGDVCTLGANGALKFCSQEDCCLADFTYVDNVAWGLLLSGEGLDTNISAGETYFISNNAPMRPWAFVSMICGELRYDRPKYQFPMHWYALGATVSPFLFGKKWMKMSWVLRNSVDHYVTSQKAKRELGYEPVIALSTAINKCGSELKKKLKMRDDFKKSVEDEEFIDERDLMDEKNKKTSKVFTQMQALSAHLCSGLRLCAGATLVALVYKKISCKHSCPLFSFPAAEKLLSLPNLQLATISASSVGMAQLLNVFASASTVPHSKGVPLLGVAMQFNNRPVSMCKEIGAQCGDVYSFQLLNQRITFFSSPESLEVILKSPDEYVKQDEVYKLTIPLFGKGVIYGTDLETRQQQIYYCSQVFSTKNMTRYVSMITKECELYFEKYTGSGIIEDFNALFFKLILNTACRCLLGREIRERMADDVAEMYLLLEEGLTYIANVFPNLPIKAHRNRDYARKRMFAMFQKVIDERRASGTFVPDGDELDLLHVLMKSKYKDGRNFTDYEICGLLTIVLFGGQHTSEKTASWALINIVFNRDRVLPRMLDEILKFDTLTYDDVQEKTPYLNAIIIETLRMYPPLAFVFRYVHKRRFYKGHVIEPHTIIAASPAQAGSNPAIFDNVDTFDPEKWIENDWEEYRKELKFVAFGGGRHTCLGRRFAILQIKTIMTYIFKNFVLEPRCKFPKVHETTMVNPPGTPMRTYYRRIEKGEDVRQAWESTFVKQQ